MNQKFQRYTFKPQLAHFVCLFAGMISLMLRRRVVIQNFVTLYFMMKML